MIIYGGKSLCGSIDIGGSKHSSLAILGALFLFQEIALENLADIDDVKHMIKIYESMGVVHVKDNDMDYFNTTNFSLSLNEFWRIEKLRSSILLLGSLLLRSKDICMPFPGGDKIGIRPIQEFVNLLHDFNIECSIENGSIKASLKSELHSDYVINLGDEKKYFSKRGNNRTALAMIYAAANKGKTVLRNIACNIEIYELGIVLEKLNCKIVNLGKIRTGKRKVDLIITSKGIVNYSPGYFRHSISSDKGEMAFWLIASAITNGRITCNLHKGTEIISRDWLGPHTRIHKAILNKASIDVSICKNGHSFIVEKPKRSLSSFRLRTPIETEYTGVVFDTSALFIVLMLFAKGKSFYYDDKKFRSARYMSWISQLDDLGFHYKIKANGIEIHGRPANTFTSSRNINFIGKDIRGACALLLIALALPGKVNFDGMTHINRGIENIVSKLKAVGLEIND